MTGVGKEPSVKLEPGVLLSAGEVAAHLSVTLGWLKARRRRNEPPAWFRLSNRVIRYRAEDVTAFIESVRKGIA